MKDKKYVVYADEETHTELAVMAAKRKISITQVLKELVNQAKEQEKANE